MRVNVGEWMTHRALMIGSKEGFVGKNGRYTFQEMNDRVNRFANYLLSQGIKQGDRIALLCKNHEDFVTAFFGSAKIGAISIPVNWRLQVTETSYILQNSGAKVLIYDEAFSDNVQELKKESLVELYICSGNHQEDITFDSILESSNTEEPNLVSFNDDCILIMYTSGTTGKPKGAMITHHNLIAASLGLTHTVDWWEQDRFLLVAPFFHIGGLAPLIANVHTGCTTVLLEDFEPVTVWKQIEQERITTMMSVPAMLAFMAKTYEKVKPDCSSLRNITCGASPVPASLIQLFKKIGISVQQVYGITEYTGAVSFWKESFDPEKYDSMGKVVMHGALKIVDIHTGEALPPGEVGEILCYGPQVFKGYWQNEEETKKVFIDGWYRSGDVGKIDEDGFLYVVDRLKDMIISGGENIYSAEVEEVLSNHPEIVKAAVIGIPNEKWGEIARAYVVKTEESSLNEEKVIHYCKSQLASYKAPKEVVFVKQLPRNAVGKILKTVLKQNDQVTS